MASFGRARRTDSDEDLDSKRKVDRAGMGRVRQLFAYVWRYRLPFVVGLIFLLLSSLSALIFPEVIGDLVDSVVSEEGSRFGSRNTVALLLVGVLILQAVLSYFRIDLFARVSERAMRDIRLDLYQQMMALPIPFFEQRRVGELQSRITNDVTQLQSTFSTTLAEFIRQMAILVVGITAIFIKTPQLTFVMLLSFPVLIAGAIVFGRFIRKLSKRVQDELADANTVVEETLQAVQVVKSYTNERHEVRRYGTALEGVVRLALRTARFRGAFASFVIFAIFGGIILVLWYGLGLVGDGLITFGDLTSFVIYTMFIGGSVGGMGALYGELQRAIGASERILEILESPVEADLRANPPAPGALRGDIRYEGVTFCYPARPDVTVLRDLHLEVAAGQKVALVGQSGAGKSTLVQLLLRFYDVTDGRITLDGQDLQSFDLSELRYHVGVVPQETILFGGTIRENIAYGRPGATDAEVREAARQANALGFIEQFPEGFGTVVGERGVKLSGGQRQRVAIARAILKDPTILVLDEATSSLDAESEHLVQEALDTLMENRTTIIIAHRLATIRKADRIYVLHEGQIAEQGTHEELSRREDGYYSNLLRLQFAVEES